QRREGEELTRRLAGEIAGREALQQALAAETAAREHMKQMLSAETAALKQALSAETATRERMQQMLLAETAAREALGFSVMNKSRQADIAIHQLRAEDSHLSARVSILLEEMRKRTAPPLDGTARIASNEDG